jgi:hypothetical protein
MSKIESNPPKENTSLLNSTAFLAAFIAAIVAAFANAYVAFINNNTLLDIETQKESSDQGLQARKETEEQSIEERKAEFSRLLEMSKLDIEPFKLKLKVFCEMGLIVDQKFRNLCNSARQSNVTLQPPPVNNQKIKDNYSSATWDSDWVSGGHNQDEMCNTGLMALKGREEYKDKTITKRSSSEDSKKDFFGHVQYRYHCTYEVSSN